MAGLARAGPALLMVAATLLCLLGPVGCASNSPKGFYYVVRPGDNLYRIGRRYGVPTSELVRTNRIENVRELKVGTRLWIPRQRPRVRRSGPSNTRRAETAPRDTKLRFAWPVKGKITSGFGWRNGRNHEGLDLAAPSGTAIRAAEAGKVIHSARLGDYGKTVILKHAGYYRTVYAHTRKIFVRKGQFVERGQKIAEVGSSGRSSGPHLHFEIRRRETARDPLQYLP